MAYDFSSKIVVKWSYGLEGRHQATSDSKFLCDSASFCKTSHLTRLRCTDEFQFAALGFLEDVSMNEKVDGNKFNGTLVKKMVSQMGSYYIF